jgi:hypothetical protein
MTDTFQIGATSSMSDLETVLGSIVPVEPDWSYRPFSTNVKLQSGVTQGNGFPVVKWRFNHLSQSDRETLRETYCAVPNLSKTGVYIHTPITETNSGVLIWKTFKCILNWPPEEEDFQADQILGFILTFTHCEVQS